MSRSTIKAAFDNIGAQTQPLSITPVMISAALNALLNEAVLQSEMSSALAEKANASEVTNELATKMVNTAIEIVVERNAQTGDLSYYSGDSVFSAIAENKVVVAKLTIHTAEGHNVLGKTMALVTWNNSSTGVYKLINIYTNGAAYNLRYKVADGTWRILTKSESSIADYLPEN